MRDVNVFRTLRTIWAIILLAALWLGGVQTFAHHHHENFQSDNDCAMCHVIASGVRLTDSATPQAQVPVFHAPSCPDFFRKAVPLSARLIKLRAPSTSPPA